MRTCARYWQAGHAALSKMPDVVSGARVPHSGISDSAGSGTAITFQSARAENAISPFLITTTRFASTS